MTPEETAQQRLRLETYENRAVTRWQAMAAREALVKQLEAEGVDASKLLAIKAKRGRRKKAD